MLSDSEINGMKKRSFADMNASSAGHPLPDSPSSSQSKVVEVAIRRNTIAVLESGSGKTLIAGMLIKNMARAPDKKSVVFLAPTVHLVNQQFEVIKQHTKLDVGSYYGAKGVDEWTLEQWQKEISEHDVLFMTPQILLDALRKAFINLEKVCLVVLDKCHRATGNHPYSKIMTEFYTRSCEKPKIFGMTTSPVIKKGGKNQMSDLESILDSQIYIAEDKIELEKSGPSAKETCKFYDPTQLLAISNVKEKVESVGSKFDASLSATAAADHPLPDSSSSSQSKVIAVAIRRNTIAVLESSSGKTLIAAMLIKHMARDKKPVVFLAPTVHLVNQQFDVIKQHTKLDVGFYYGAKGVDEWTLEQWEKEISEHDVLVMTPQILLDALRKAFINLEKVCLLVLDECHRATGNHPYSKIMTEFYSKSSEKPKIFGMTVIKKGVSSKSGCKNQMSDLENILDSQIYIAEDKVEVEKSGPSAKETCKFYDPIQLLAISNVKEKVESVWSKFDASLSDLQESLQNSNRDVEVKAKVLRMRLCCDHANILCCIDDLGLICAHEAVKVCLENAPKANEECEFYRESSLQCLNYFNEVLVIFQEVLPPGDEGVKYAGFDPIKAADMGYISPKLLELLQLLQSFE